MAEPERKCSTCKFYEPAPIWRKGWCRNPLLYAPQQSHLVAEDDLDCSRGLSDYWEAADGTGPNAGVNLAMSGTRDPFTRGATEPPANPWDSGQQPYNSSYGSSYGSPYSSGPITTPPDDDGYAPHESAPAAPAGGARYAGSVGDEEVHNPWEPGQPGYGTPPAQHEEDHGYGYVAPAPGQEQNPWQNPPPDAHGQGGYEQGGYGQEQQAYPPAGYNEGGYSQGGYDQGGYQQGGYPQGGYPQGGYDQQGGYVPPQPPNAPPTNAGASGSGQRRVVPQPAAAGRERSLAYYTEERYWTDYAKLIIPVVVVIVLLLFTWFIVTGKLRGGNGDATATAGASTTVASSAGAGGTRPAGTPASTVRPGGSAASGGPSVITASGTVPVSGVTGSSVARTPQAGTGQPTLPVTATKRFVVANTDGVGANLRDKPDTKTGKIVTNVPEGTEVQATGAAVDGEGGTWYPVQVGNNTGFIKSDFLKAVS